MAESFIYLLLIIHTQDIFIYISTKIKTNKIGKMIKIHLKLWFGHHVLVERPFKLDKNVHSLIWLGRLLHKFKPDTVKLR